MTAGDPERAPATIAGLFTSAASLYARRIPFYALLAIAAFAVEYLVGVLMQPLLTLALDRAGSYGLRGDALLAGSQVVADAFLVAAVSIGVARDAAGKPLAWRAIAVAASERWGVVAVIGFVAFLVFYATASSVFGPPDATAFGLLIAPIIMFWAALTIAQTVAAVEPAASRLRLPLIGLGKGLATSFRLVNLGRLALLAVVLAFPLLIEIVLGEQLRLHRVPDPGFWASVPLDALTVGPLQALATVFYLDFARRAAR